MFFLAYRLGFGYADLLQMEHIEAVNWCKMLIKQLDDERREVERLKNQ